MTVILGTTLRPEDGPLLEVAALLAARLAAPLRLVHVCEDHRAPILIGTDQEHLLGTVREDLSRQAEKLQHATGVVVRPHLAAGSIVDALVSLAEFELATLLVVGPTQRRLRAIAERVARSSRVPVLVPRAPERLKAWLQDGRPLRLLVGADLGRAAEAARRFAVMLGSLGPSEAEVALVTSPEEAHTRLGIAPPEGGLSPEAESALLRGLSNNAPPGESPAALRVISGHGRPDVHLVTRADEGNFDIIVVGQRQRSIIERIWHGSISRGVLQSAPVAVVSVPVPLGDADRSFRPPRVVVVGADATETDHRALAHALGHTATGGTVHLVHVLLPTDTSAHMSPDQFSAALRQAREDARSRLERTTRDAVMERPISMETHVLEGHPPEQLLALSARVGADLVVLGSRKRTAIGRMLIGSLARAIVEDSRFPVLIVPARGP